MNLTRRARRCLIGRPTNSRSLSGSCAQPAYHVAICQHIERARGFMTDSTRGSPGGPKRLPAKQKARTKHRMPPIGKACLSTRLAHTNTAVGSHPCRRGVHLAYLPLGHSCRVCHKRLTFIANMQADPAACPSQSLPDIPTSPQTKLSPKPASSPSQSPSPQTPHMRRARACDLAKRALYI